MHQTVIIVDDSFYRCGYSREVHVSQASSIEQRLAHVEQDLNDLNAEFNRLNSNQNWIDRIVGSFKDDLEFKEILRLGREIRQADRPDQE